MYDYLVIDTVNLGYIVFNSPTDKSGLNPVIDHNGKRVYQRFISSMMETLQFLQEKFLSPGGEVVMLYDNYHSRQELEKMLRPLKESQNRRKVNKDYKRGRKMAKIEFYNSLDVLRVWAFTAPEHIHTARIPNLEADDLVNPCLQFLRHRKPGAKVLLVTNDSDWCRYLDEDTQYLPHLYENPEGVEFFVNRFGFKPTEDRVVLYKILEGDDADGVSMVFPEISPTERQAIVTRYSSTIDFLLGVHGDPDFEKYSTLVKSREIDVKIAYQLLAAIPVSEAHFKGVFTAGRNFAPLQKRWDEIFSTRTTAAEPAKFEFGSLKIPRKDPQKEKRS